MRSSPSKFLIAATALTSILILSLRWAASSGSRFVLEPTEKYPAPNGTAVIADDVPACPPSRFGFGKHYPRHALTYLIRSKLPVRSMSTTSLPMSRAVPRGPLRWALRISRSVSRVSGGSMAAAFLWRVMASWGQTVTH